MKINNKISKLLLIGLMSSTTLLSSVNVVHANEITPKGDWIYQVYDITASALRVRTSASINGAIKTTLSNGNDVVKVSSGTHQKWETVGGVQRLWKSVAYPSSSAGKYTDSVRGWICAREVPGDSYTNSSVSSYAISSSGNYLYNDQGLSSKHKSINKGDSYGNGGKIPHSSSNLNAWMVAPGGVTKYMDGWKSTVK